jgi:sulfur relay (sulfurtransferase) DsrC/TusE family protein
MIKLLKNESSQIESYQESYLIKVCGFPNNVNQAISYIVEKYNSQMHLDVSQFRKEFFLPKNIVLNLKDQVDMKKFVKDKTETYLLKFDL